MLIACDACHRQYDVGSLEPGRRVRCFCGALNTVPERAPRPVAMMHCSTCGGKLDGKALQCGYCGSEVAMGDRGLGEVCPECMSRMLAGARFCSSCGLDIRPESVLKALTSTKCPRCASAMAACEGPDHTFVECTVCGGVWLDEQIFERIARERSLSAERSARPASEPSLGRRDEEMRYLKCPTCSELMHRKNFAAVSGVIIDWCGGHGYWFDADELERVLAFVEARGFDAAHFGRGGPRSPAATPSSGLSFPGLDDTRRRNHFGGFLGELVVGLLGG